MPPLQFQARSSLWRQHCHCFLSLAAPFLLRPSEPQEDRRAASCVSVSSVKPNPQLHVSAEGCCCLLGGGGGGRFERVQREGRTDGTGLSPTLLRVETETWWNQQGQTERSSLVLITMTTPHRPSPIDHLQRLNQAEDISVLPLHVYVSRLRLRPPLTLMGVSLWELQTSMLLPLVWIRACLLCCC